MLLAYLDESYARGTAYWIGVALVHEERVDELCRATRLIPKSLPSDAGIPGDVELHGYDIFHGEGFFEPLKRKPEALARIYRKGLEALVAAKPEILFVGLDWPANSTEASLELRRIATFRHVLPAIEQRCAQRSERCLLIGDEEETTTYDVIAALREHQGDLHAEESECRILDTAMFVESYDCPGVQVTDLATFLHQRRAGGRERDPRAVKLLEKWWEMVEPHVQCAQRYSEPETWPERAPRRPRRTKSRQRRLYGSVRHD